MLYVLQDTTSYNTHYCGFGYSRYTFPGALLRTHTRASNHIVSFAVYVNQISVYSKEYTQMIVGTGDVPGVLAFYKSCGFEYSPCIKGFFTENYDHPIIDNGVLLKDMIYLKRKIGF